MTGRRRGSVDWRAVRERLAAAQAASEALLAPPPEAVRALLAERARRLARPLGTAPAEGELIEVLTFTTAGARSAIELRLVREVLRCAALTPVPGAPAHVVGVFPLRGRVLSAVDLGPLLGQPGHRSTADSRIVVLGERAAELGLMVDSAGALEQLRRDDLLAPPPSDAGGWHCVRGLTREALALLDGEALLLHVAGRRHDTAAG